MSKLDIEQDKEYGWNNIQPIYVKPTNHSPYTAPLWVLVISIAVNTTFNIIMTLLTCNTANISF
jgi:hypothetical protein